ncbi:MAG: hypothetical protein ACOZJZ_01650 [Pseudomonadota bacterium]
MWVAAAAAAIAFSEPARAELVPVAWDSAGQFAKEISIAPGKFVELCEKLPAGAKVAWRFEAAAPLNFNIHYHEGQEVRFPAKREQVGAGEGTLEAPVAQDYCWMWTNKAAAQTRLTLQLKRSAPAPR